MKPLIKKKYLAIWYINVDSADGNPVLISQMVDNFIKSVSRGADSPWHELEVFLEAAVLGYFVPIAGEPTRLEIKEFEIRIDNEETC